ncbi:hypothetical protein K7I03_27330 [Streptomyces mobaraensis]|uniref:DUF6980 family protein n=2 Tax=Streptomyces TaxID=1883 RepID=UPI00163C45A5|nr:MULTISPECIES: hypothetical protein [Streptomyces]MBC2879422.1 hypothetical protein [Streptomyces sp. TYQ1024]UBI41287.1 hypothetical protein K7I03_27330 [Streptomyces mobaraensis]UKW33785.1 hypothetical protein MCU78_27265 [Streptomyces sp. TYQ1024]
MTRRLNWHCDTHADAFACPDALVVFSARFREYGLIVHDGGISRIGIGFCPWCGQRLPESQRARGFDELEARGIDPCKDDVATGFQDDAWPRSAS